MTKFTPQSFYIIGNHWGSGDQIERLRKNEQHICIVTAILDVTQGTIRHHTLQGSAETNANGRRYRG